MGDRNCFCGSDSRCSWLVTLSQANNYPLISAQVIPCVSSESRAHRQEGVGLTLLLLLQSISIPVGVPKCPYPYPSSCVHAFIWKHLQDTDLSPSPAHKSWFGCCCFPGFGNVCDNVLHSVCGPGGEHGGFSFVGGNTEPFVSSALVKAVPVPWLWCEVEGFWGGLLLREG